MPSEFQLRDYIVKPNEMDAWVEEWKAKIFPLRKKFGFKIVGAWRVKNGDDNHFIWILRYDGKKSGEFKKADRKYYSSKDRKRISPNPARHLAKADQWMMTKVA